MGKKSSVNLDYKYLLNREFFSQTPHGLSCEKNMGHEICKMNQRQRFLHMKCCQRLLLEKHWMCLIFFSWSSLELAPSQCMYHWNFKTLHIYAKTRAWWNSAMPHGEFQPRFKHSDGHIFPISACYLCSGQEILKPLLYCYHYLLMSTFWFIDDEGVCQDFKASQKKS